MAIRQDVMRLAERLAAETGINQDHMYHWLMQVGRSKGINPKKLSYTTGRGIIYVTGERDVNRLERFQPRTNSYTCDGPDYEELILARQEAWTD